MDALLHGKTSIDFVEFGLSQALFVFGISRAFRCHVESSPRHIIACRDHQHQHEPPPALVLRRNTCPPCHHCSRRCRSCNSNPFIPKSCHSRSSKTPLHPVLCAFAIECHWRCAFHWQASPTSSTCGNNGRQQWYWTLHRYRTL